jgi:uncharacterized protein (DUF2384 family)
MGLGDDEERAARLDRVREQRNRRLAVEALRSAAHWAEQGLPLWMFSATRARTNQYGLPADLWQRLKTALEDLELGEEGAAERVARLLRHAADHLELTAED